MEAYVYLYVDHRLLGMNSLKLVQKISVLGIITSLHGELCSALQCRAVTSSAVQCHAVQCSSVQGSKEQCSAMQCSAVQGNEEQCSSVRCIEVSSNVVEYNGSAGCVRTVAGTINQVKPENLLALIDGYSLRSASPSKIQLSFDDIVVVLYSESSQEQTYVKYGYQRTL